MNYLSRLETFYAYDFILLNTLFNIRNLPFEEKFLDYLEKVISKNLENVQSKNAYYAGLHVSPLINLIKAYSRHGYYEKAEKLIYKLKLLLTKDNFTQFSFNHLFYLNMFEVYNLLRQNDPKAIERANTLLHYIDAQNDLFPVARMFEIKNTFVKDVQRLNKTGIPFPTEDEE